MSDFKPLLAGKAPALDEVRYPVLASPKIDGIRCLTTPNGAVSRTLKPIPNRYVALTMGGLPAGLDGELWVKGATTFGEVSSAIMSRDGEPEFQYYVFDHFRNPTAPYRQRLAEVADLVREFNQALPPGPQHTWLRLLDGIWLANGPALAEYEARMIEAGYEGVMLRSPTGSYKFGRSSTKEGILLKLKRFEDAEAVVVGTVERQHNTNEATRDAFGRTERSSHKAGMVPAGDLGALVVRTPAGVEFEIGTGFDASQRRGFWQIRHALVGRLAKYKHQPHGAKDAPRCPVFLGFRDPADMG